MKIHMRYYQGMWRTYRSKYASDKPHMAVSMSPRAEVALAQAIRYLNKWG